MKFTKVDKLPGAAFRSRERCKIQKTLQAFVESNIAVARVNTAEREYASIKACQATMAKSAREMHLDHVKVVVRGDAVYLINTLLFEEQK